MRQAARTSVPGTAARVAGAVLATACVLAMPGVARAQWSAFVPRPYDNRAWIESYGSYERDNYKGSARKVKWEDWFFREKLGVSSIGYSYDPRFLQYKLSIAGAFKQEKFENSAFGPGSWRENESIEYDARLYFLPEHHYNAQVFASRHEPLYPQQSITQHNSYVDDYGAMVRYRLKPWFFDADYLDSTLHQTNTRSTVRRLNVDGEYFKRFQNGYEFSAEGTARPSWYDDSEGLDGTAEEYLFSTLVNLDRVRLDSTVTDNHFEQDRGPLDGYEADQFQWWELLTVYFPWNFRTDLTWRLHENDSVFNQQGLPDQRRYTDDGHSIELEVIHRLYESVDTRYRFINDKRDSRDFESELFSHSLSVDYTKQIPYGQVLTGGSYGNAEIQNDGFASVINDPYAATPVPGIITLRQQAVDETSIIVQLKSPIPPFDAITLVQGVHYQLNTLVEPFEIQIVNLPAEFVVPGNYDFFLTYSLSSGTYDLGIDTGSANLTFELFGHRVAPFFRYLGQRTDVTSGTYPGVPIDSDSYNAGLRLEYGRWRSRGEYLYLDWPVNPYELWRAELQYVGTISRSITAYGTATYVNRHYFGGDFPYDYEDETEQTETLAGTITKQFYEPNLALSAGGSWTHLHGITDSDAWSAHSSLVWRIGKLDVTIGLSAYGSNSQTRDFPDYERDHEMIYFNLRRQLL